MRSHEKMLCTGTDPESYITEYPLVYEEKRDLVEHGHDDRVRAGLGHLAPQPARGRSSRIRRLSTCSGELLKPDSRGPPSVRTGPGHLAPQPVAASSVQHKPQRVQHTNNGRVAGISAWQWWYFAISMRSLPEAASAESGVFPLVAGRC